MASNSANVIMFSDSDSASAPIYCILLFLTSSSGSLAAASNNYLTLAFSDG